MANLDLKALLQGIKPVPSVPSKSATNFGPSNQNPNNFTTANQNPTNFTSVNQNPTESGGYQDYGKYIELFLESFSAPSVLHQLFTFIYFSDEYQVIDEYNQDDTYSRSSYDYDVHDRRHSRSRSRDRDIRKPATASSNNTQLPVCQWYSQRGVCRRFKSLCPKSHPGSISTQNGMVHERPKGGGQEKDTRVPNTNTTRSREYRRSRSRSRERFPRRSRSRERDSRPRTRRSRSRSRERIYGHIRRRSRSQERHNRLTEQQVPPTITSTDINLTENNIISQPDITQPDVNPISTDITKPPPSMMTQILDSIKTKAGLGETQPENPVIVKPLIMPIKSLAQDLGENIMAKSEGFKEDITKRRLEKNDRRRSRSRENRRSRSRSGSRSRRRFTEEKSDRSIRDRRRSRSKSRDNNRRTRSRSREVSKRRFTEEKIDRKPEAASNNASNGASTKKLIPYGDSDEENASKKLIPYEDSESGEDDDGNWKRKNRN